MKMTAQNRQRGFTPKESGFTLIELLVVIGILAILLAITLIAINPAKQFSSANNTKRASNVEEILNAISQYTSDTKGILPAGIPTTGAAVPIAGGGTCTASTCADLCTLLVPKYIAGLPVDPSSNPSADITTCPTGTGAQYSTGYTVVSSNGRVTVAAPSTDLTYGATLISVTR